MMSNIDRQVQPGPCMGCGAEGYPLSYGGPGVCPMCDAYPPDRILKALAQENRWLRSIIEQAGLSSNNGTDANFEYKSYGVRHDGTIYGNHPDATPDQPLKEESE